MPLTRAGINRCRENLFRARHQIVNDMASQAISLEIEAVRGGAFVYVVYDYAAIQEPFDSLRKARVYAKQFGLPIGSFKK